MRRPSGDHRGTERAVGAEREPGADAALQVPDPDVGLPAPRIGEVEGEPVAARRERRVVVVARVADGLALLARSGPPRGTCPRAHPSGTRASRRGTPRRARGPTLSVPTCSASGTGSPVVFKAFASKGWATSVLSRTKRRYPGRRVRDERLRRREELRLRRVERADPVGAVLRLLPDRHVEKVPAVRKELRPADLRLLARGVGLDGGDGRSPGGRDTVDGLGARAVEEDDALASSRSRRSLPARRRSSAAARPRPRSSSASPPRRSRGTGCRATRRAASCPRCRREAARRGS